MADEKQFLSIELGLRLAKIFFKTAAASVRSPTSSYPKKPNLHSTAESPPTTRV